MGEGGGPQCVGEGLGVGWKAGEMWDRFDEGHRQCVKALQGLGMLDVSVDLWRQ